MKITELPFAVLRFQYQLARIPLQVIEEQVLSRLGEEAPARLMYERSLGRLDMAVGTALGAPDVERRGAALVQRSDALTRAARLDVAADRAVQEAGGELKDAIDAAAMVREQASEDKVDTVVQARAKAAHEKVAAINEAEKRVDAAKKRADTVAGQRKDAVEAAKRDEQGRISAAEQSVTAVAQAEAEDAQKKRAAAAAKIAQADRVEQLADAKKQADNGDGSNDA
ncbi:MAG: hypothetical protein ACXU6Q_10210 [Croceibacterium sp.]